MHGKFFDLSIPCSTIYCNCDLAIVDEITSSHYGYVDLICFECKHRQQISFADYNSICNVKKQKVMEIFEKAGLTKQFDKETLMKFTENVRLNL